MQLAPQFYTKTPIEWERRIKRLSALPPLPPAARMLLEARADPVSAVSSVVELIDTDPVLRPWIVRCARIPCFITKTKTDSVASFVTQTFGAELAIDIALSLTLSRSFGYVCDGPLGAHAYWRHAIGTAVLAQHFARHTVADPGLKPGTAFLAGFLHNFGFMLIGHLYPPEFKLLNRLLALHPEVPVTVLERCVLGLGEAQELLECGHARIGAWLMEGWGMPPAVIVVNREHHNSDYAGPDAIYTRLVRCASGLLGERGIGEGADIDVNESLTQALGLSLDNAQNTVDGLLDDITPINDLVRAIASR